MVRVYLIKLLSEKANTGQARGRVDLAAVNNIGEVIYQSAYNKYADELTAECALTSIARGIYYVRVATGNNATVQKLAIEN